MDGPHHDLVVLQVGQPGGEPLGHVEEGVVTLVVGCGKGGGHHVLLEDGVESGLLVQEEDPEGDLEGGGGVEDGLGEEEGGQLVGAARRHELGGSRGDRPVLPLQVGHPQVRRLGQQGTRRDAPPAPRGGPGLAMALVEHDGPHGVDLGDGGQVDFGNEGVEEEGKVAPVAPVSPDTLLLLQYTHQFEFHQFYQYFSLPPASFQQFYEIPPLLS